MARQEGVFYPIHEYGSVLRRLTVMAIDGAILVLILALLILALLLSGWLAVADAIAQEPSIFAISILLLWLALAYLYLAVVERSEFGTLGLHWMGLRLVSLQGERPSLFQTTLRFAWIFLGPLNLIIDLLWLPGERERQTLRDKLAATYVVRRGAEPLGRGPIVHTQQCILGYAFLFSEVRRDPVGG